MPYYMILKAEVPNPTEFPGILEKVAHDLINGDTVIRRLLPEGKGDYSFAVYKPNNKEDVEVDSFIVGAQIL